MRIILGYGHDEHGRLAVRIQLHLEARGHLAGFNLDPLSRYLSVGSRVRGALWGHK